MLSTSKFNNDSDWEDQIEIKSENITQYIDEIKEEFVDCQEYEIKIKKFSVDEELEELPQECIKVDEDIIGGDHENVMVALNGESECSAYNISSSTSVSPASNTTENTLKNNVDGKCKGLKIYEHIISKQRKKIHKCEYCDYQTRYCSSLKIHINSKHTRENIHKCQYCDFESPYSL